jgi:hypothetical protein
MPYLFSDSALDGFPPARVLREAAGRLAEGETLEGLSHAEYFKLCLSAHYSTCGTPVPTDVDRQIRQKLWSASLPLSTALEMAEWVLTSRDWDFTLVSTRFVHGGTGTESGIEKQVLSGHYGEWFTVAAGAYSAFSSRNEPEAQEMRDRLFHAIAAEVKRHSDVFASLSRVRDGVGVLKASSSIAHNLGDLDRVMDMWSLPVGDPLRLAFYKLGATPFDSNGKLRYSGRLWVAGELYKEKLGEGSMALENHRHFALRKPRALRRYRELVVPTAPFFDDWGEVIARRWDEWTAEEHADLLEALTEGWERQPGTFAYGRALVGMMQVSPEVADTPWIRDALLRSGAPSKKSVGTMHGELLKVSRADFEAFWAESALRAMDDIPSRA